MTIPTPEHAEYRLTLVWRSDAVGNGVRTYLIERSRTAETLLQTSFHPTLNLHDALESALTEFFEGKI